MVKDEIELPIPILTKIHGKPTYATLTIVKAELFEDAASAYSTRGNGALGHTVLVLGAVAYQEIAGVAFNVPVNPGPIPIYPGGASARVIQETADAHKVESADHALITKLEIALKRKLMEAVDPQYYNVLKHRVTNYTNVSLFALLTHLTDKYSNTDATALRENLKTISNPWELNDNMDPLYTRGEDAVAMSTAAGDTISELTLIRETLQVLRNTHAFPQDIREWMQRPEDQQT
jgi:hypothetical protein